MREVTGLAKIKTDYARRIKAAINGIRRQVLPCDQRLLDRLQSVAAPGFAYGARGLYELDFIPGAWRDRTRNKSKFAVVLHEIGQALRTYWTLIRTDDQIGLDYLIQRLENYAENDFKGCELLGGPDCGYGLFDPRK